MEKCRSNQIIERKNSDNCIVSEFPINDHDINFAIIKVSSRYPDSGFATNTISKEIVYVQEGLGKVIVNDVEYHLKTGDVILISPNEKFYWDGNMTLHISCTPAFTPEQHIHLE
ncbi:MAG: AraC family ligand binding domain-containing protein [Coxiellaceae bacterium]|nr:AraC family ligand binding domain-containing protein [Coxiellaceae bacterium]